MKKRISALLLSVVLCLGMLSTTAFAASVELKATNTDGTTVLTVSSDTPGEKLCALYGDPAHKNLLLLFYADDTGTDIKVPTLAEGGTYYITIGGTESNTEYRFPGTTDPDKQYTITFDAGEGKIIGDSTRVTKKDGTLPSLAEVEERTGYTFDGWFTEATGGDPITTDTVFTKDTTVYAHWTPVAATQYTITFNANNGTVDPATAKTGTDGKLTSWPTPTRTGYRFDGWYTAATGGDPITTDTVFTKDTTVYAHWTPATAGQYTITFDANGGTLTDSARMQTGTDGKLTKLPADPKRSDYTFDGWYDAATGGTKITNTTVFTKDATVYAHWTKNSTGGGGGGGSSSSSSNVTVKSTKNGSVSYSPSRPSKGSTVTLTVRPNSGYQLDSIKVLDSKGAEVELTKTADNKYTFVMPSGKVTVDAKFAKPGETPDTQIRFTDVSEGSYYYDAVYWAVDQGITNGKTSTTFDPNGTCTRAQMVTFLWRAAGSPSVEGTSPFTDVTSGSYYYDAVLWAVKEGITTGTTATTFNPNGLLTRAHTVTFLYRYAKSPAVTAVSNFSDVPAGQYYTNAVSWAVAEGITTGYSDGQFKPANNCTRAQTVTFLHRMLNK